MSDSRNASTGGISLGGVLGVVFIVLKLTDNIDWSWWWVLSPFWIPLGIVAMILAVILIVAVIGIFGQWRAERRKLKTYGIRR